MTYNMIFCLLKGVFFNEIRMFLQNPFVILKGLLVDLNRSLNNNVKKKTHQNMFNTYSESMKQSLSLICLK